MSVKMEEDIKRWTARRKSALVLDIIQGKTTVAEASRAYDLSPSEVEQWVDDGKRGMENALRANPLDIKEQYERQIKDLQEAYGEAMLELRARKNCSPCWARTRSDRDDPSGTAGRRRYRPDHEAVPLVRCPAPQGVLQAGQGRTESRSEIQRADQVIDRGGAFIRLPDGGVPAGVQQEHGAAPLPVDGLAGQETTGRVPATHPGTTVGGDAAQRALVHGPVPGMGRA